VPRKTPAQSAQDLYQLISRALSQAALEDYGINATTEQANHILRELLSLSLFWARSALEAGLSDKDSRRVWIELQQCVHHAWESELGLKGHDVASYFKELDARRLIYVRVTSEGGAPIAVATEAVSVLETEAVIEPADHQKILALFIDLVPADELGEAVEELELMD
jgi:hypothetical protein